MKRLLWIGMLALLVLLLGLWLGSRSRQPDAYQVERAALKIQFARSMLPFRVAFYVLLGTVVLSTLAGLGWSTIRWLNRRADTLYPDASGLYPIRENRVGRARVFHDPNRTLGGATVYASGGPPVDVRYPLPGGHVGAQQQVTAQAQAAQVLRAAVSGPSPLPSPRSWPVDLLAERRVSRPLPEVQELPYEPSHIDRLLLQDGDPAGPGPF